MSCISLVMLAGGISRGAFGIFFKPLANDLGWSAAEISGTFSFSMIIEGAISAVSGLLSDKFGTRIVLTISGIIAGSGFALMSRVHEMWQMYLIYGLAMGVGLGGIFVPIVSIIARRFKANRSLMTGIALSANGIGLVASPIIAHNLIVAFEWRESYIILGIILFILIVLPAQFIKRPRREPKEEVSTKKNVVLRSFTFQEARRTRTFWMMVALFGLAGFCMTTIMVHLVPYSIEVGISAAAAASISACYGIGTIAGRLLLGTIADKTGNRRMIIFGLLLLTVSLFWLTISKSVWSLTLFALVSGFGMGGVTSSQSPLMARYFGLKAHGETFGMMGGIAVVFGATGAFVTGYLFDLVGQYQIPFLVNAVFGLGALIVGFLLKPPVAPATAK
jgi:MFS family permease